MVLKSTDPDPCTLAYQQALRVYGAKDELLQEVTSQQKDILRN